MPMYWIGVDEAGYGARLGPLVVSASLWQINHPVWTPESVRDVAFLSVADEWSWQEQFQTPKNVAATSSPPSTNFPPAIPLLVADSKKVYHSGQGLAGLRRIVASLLSAIEATPSPDPESVNPLAILNQQDAVEQRLLEVDGDPWVKACWAYQHHAKRVSFSPDNSLSPVYWRENSGCGDDPDSATDTEDAHVNSAIETTINTSVWHTPTLRPQKLASAILSELEFNRGLIKYGNKANLLSATSMQLANHVLQQCPDDCDVVIDFDRHGGRKRYLSLLMEYFPADWLMVASENAWESSYYWDCGSRRVYFRFSVDGERRYPVAVASLASKYGRELGMACVNTFWQQRAPTLRASAGYPVDAARMLNELRSHFTDLPVPLTSIWRDA